MAAGSLTTATSPNGSRVVTIACSKCSLVHASIGLSHNVLKNESGRSGSAFGTGAGGRKRLFSGKGNLATLKENDLDLRYTVTRPANVTLLHADRKDAGLFCERRRSAPRLRSVRRSASAQVGNGCLLGLRIWLALRGRYFDGRNSLARRLRYHHVRDLAPVET